MKKFIFRLEMLLKIRKASEGSLKRDLEHANRKMNQVKERERVLQTQISTLMDEMQKKRAEGKLTLQETYMQILEHLNTSLKNTQQNFSAQERQIEEQKERLMHAIRQRKVIEKIQEKHYAGWQNQESQTEGALVDEISCQKTMGVK